MSYPIWKNNCAIYTLIDDHLKENKIIAKNIDLALKISNDMQRLFTTEKENKNDKYYCGTCDLTFSEKNKKRHLKHSTILNSNLKEEYTLSFNEGNKKIKIIDRSANDKK